jgi:hypothetical protein
MKLRCVSYHRIYIMLSVFRYSTAPFPQVLRAQARQWHLRLGVFQEQRCVVLCILPAVSIVPDLCVSDDLSPSAAKGIVALDKTASVKRTKNVRDGFEFCIRVDAPSAVTAHSTGVKAWPKLVMALRNEPDMVSWIEAIRAGIESREIGARRRSTFVPSAQRAGEGVVFSGKALKEVSTCLVCVCCGLLSSDLGALFRRILSAFP